MSRGLHLPGAGERVIRALPMRSASRRRYRGGRLPLFHVDLYRLNDAREIEELGLDEIAADGALAIEWADKLDAGSRLEPPRCIAVHIAHGDGDERTIRISR